MNHDLTIFFSLNDIDMSRRILASLSSSSKFVRVQQKSRDIETTDDGRICLVGS
jgi:hypothetical protein